MTMHEAAADAVLHRGEASMQVRIDVARFRWAVYAGATLAVISWTLVSGKDLNWDALNYHLYSGLSAVHDRFRIDFFPSGAASYFNPYAQLPFYLMVVAGVPALGIGIFLAFVHSINLWLTYELGVALAGGRGAGATVMIGLLASGLAALNPVFLQLAGSSFTDLTTSLPTLGGLLALVYAHRRPALGTVALAGVLLGAAAGLKLSNAIFVIAAVPMLLLLPTPTRARLRASVAFAAACGLAFLAVAGPWAWRLWEEFGNPFFPLFNQWFRSPDFITEPLKHTRFVPDSLIDGLLRPLQMAVPERMTHTEPRAPDIRYAALFLCLAAWIATSVAVRARTRDASRSFADASGGPAPRDRALVALTASFAIAWLLWLALSGNSRYFISMACVAAVLLVAIMARIARPGGRAFGYLAAALVAVQGVQTGMGAQLRWTTQTWDGAWFQVTVPERFQREPHLYLSLDIQSGSFLAAFVAPGSGLINVSGSYVLAPGHPGGDRAQRLIEANAGRLRLLLPIQRVDANDRPLPPPFEVLDDRVARFGLRTDPADCAYFTLEGGLDIARYTDGQAASREAPRTTHFLSCRLQSSEANRERHQIERQRIDLVFDAVEDACPRLFQPRRTVSDKNGTWARHYVLGSDLQLRIHDGWVKYSNPVAGGEAIVIGRVEDWIRGPQPIDCSRKRGAGFAGVLE